MQKKYSLLILAFAFMFGTIVPSLPPLKASIETGQVRFYVYPTIISSKSVGTTFAVEVWIESPSEWDDTAFGIVGYAISVRVDPRALEVMTASKIPAMRGFLEDFLVRWGYDWEGYTTSMLVGPIDKESGTILDVAEYIMGYETLGKGAGGGPIKLMRFGFKSRSATEPSPIDIFGPRIPPEMFTITAIYTTPDGVDHTVDVMDDGYYIAETPDKVFFDTSGAGYDPAAPIGSYWVRLWPSPKNDYRLDSWLDDDASGTLSVNDRIDMTNLGTGILEWYKVDWLDPTPIADDAGADMICKTIPAQPEFPLGLGVVLAIAPAIPIVYVWRTRKKVTKK